MGLKDQLKERQAKESIPSFKPDAYLDVRKNDKGKPAFQTWDSEKKEAVYSTAAIEGYLIGKAFVTQGFDAGWGSKGGTFKSTPWFNKKNIVALFNPAGDVAVKDTVEFIKANMDEFSEGTVLPKTYLYYYVLSKKTGQVLAVKTNTTIGIDQVNQFQGQDITNDYYIKLKPTTYDPEDDCISNKAKKMLGSLAKSNPPKYAKLVQGPLLDEAELEKQGVLDIVDKFKEWEAHLNKSGDVVVEEKTKEDKIQEDMTLRQAATDSAVANFEQPEQIEDEDSGLPF